MTTTANPASVQQPAQRPEPLPVRSADLFHGLAYDRVLGLERAHGNRDLMDLLEILGVAGPFRPTSPWELEDQEGKHLIHAGGYAAVPFGEFYPPLRDTVTRYLNEASHLGLPQQSLSAWRAALEANLIALLRSQAPSHEGSRVFFSNSGAEAIEAAVKFARAYRPGGGAIVNFRRGYHGKTAMALALTPNEEYQAPFRPLPGPVHTVPYGDLQAFEDLLKVVGPDHVTAVIVEPIQGEGGVIIPPPGFLAGLGERCRQHGIPIIADEIQTGLGRTGHWFASLADGLDPDIITLAKPLGGGLVPIGATIARGPIYKAMLPGTESKRHSNTFGGGTLAMVVGLRSLEIIHEEGLVEKSRRDGEIGLARLKKIQQDWPAFLQGVRGAGMLFALQVQPVAPSKGLPIDPELVHLLGAALALRSLHLHGVHGCYSLNAQRVVRLSPALNLPEALRDQLFDRVEATAADHKQSWKLLGTLNPARWVRLARLAL